MSITLNQNWRLHKVAHRHRLCILWMYDSIIMAADVLCVTFRNVIKSTSIVLGKKFTTQVEWYNIPIVY